MPAGDTYFIPQQRVAETMAIIGCGLIGGSLGLALRQRRAVGKVIGVARSEETLARAREVGAADETTRDVAEAVADADLVVLATPVGTIVRYLSVISSRLKPGCLVTDVGSTKATICDVARETLPATVHFIGGHPMAGSEQTGIAAARADLFEGATWVLTPTAEARPAALDRVQQLVAATRARPLLLSPEEHDQFAAAVSHLPHLLAAVLTTQAGEFAAAHPQSALMAAGGFRDMTRIADSDPDLWHDIFATNRDAAVKQLRSLVASLLCAADMLDRGDMHAVRELLAEARQFRRRLNEEGRPARGE